MMRDTILLFTGRGVVLLPRPEKMSKNQISSRRVAGELTPFDHNKPALNICCMTTLFMGSRLRHISPSQSIFHCLFLLVTTQLRQYLYSYGRLIFGPLYQCQGLPLFCAPVVPAHRPYYNQGIRSHAVRS